MYKIFTNKRWALLLSVLILSNILITSLSLIPVYKKSISNVTESLVNTVERQKTLIHTLYEQGKSQQEIVELYKLMNRQHYSLGQRGEFALACIEGDSMLYLFSGYKRPFYKKYQSDKHGQPMYLALQNKSGFIKAKDYEGELVYAAYTYIPSVKMGVVAKVPVAEVKKPYINSLLTVTLVFIVFISISLFVFIKISNPIIRETFDNELKFRKAIQQAPFPIMIHAEDGEVLNVSQGWIDGTGYLLSEISTIEKWATLAHGEKKSEILEKIKQLYAIEDQKKEGEFEIICLNGEKRIWHFASTSMGKLNDGRRAVISIANDVTKRKNEEDRIRQSEEKFSYFFNEMSIGCSIQQLIYNEAGEPIDYITIDCNKTFSRILNVNKEDVIGKKASLFMSADELKIWLDIFSEVAIYGFSKSYEQYSPINDKYFKGVVFRTKKDIFAVTFDDITQQRKAENSLAENEHRLKLAISSGQLGIWDWDVTRNNIVWDDRMLELYGLDRETFSKNLDAWTNNLYPDDKEQTLAILDAALKGEKDYNTTFRVLQPNGKIVYIKANGLVIRNDSGEAVRMIGINQDITESKLAEEELIKKEAMTRTSVENLPIIFYMIDNKGVFRLSIGAGLKSLGLKANEVVGLSVYDLYKDYPEIIDAIKKSMTGQTAHFESNVNGAYHFNIVSPFTDANKKTNIVGVALDITERKRIEIEVVAAKEKAEESDRLKTAFLQNMSHEIRTPMNAIMGFAELLPNNYNNKEKLENFSTIINQRCEDLLGIINDILDISKIESGQLPVSIEKCNLSKLFDEIQLFFREQQVKIKKQHIEFSFFTNCNPNNLLIATDKVKLKQIFINLITNAFKFTEKGKIEAGCLADEENGFRFYVSDTGIGIKPEKHEYIFERFAQLRDSNNRTYNGTGLGLSIVKGLVELLKGKIWVESEPGKGSTFFFTIDIKKYNTPEPPPSSQTENSQADIKANSILIVDDDLYNIDLIKEILSDLPLQISYATTGKQALDKINSSTFDLVLMDIGLPDMKGHDVITEILQKYPSIKIIAQTAYASADDEAKAMSCGCTGFLSKPLKSRALKAMVFKYLA